MIKFNQLFLFILLGSTIYYLYHQFFQKVDSTIKTHPVTAIYRRLTAKSTAGKIISSFLSSSTTVLKNVSNAYILNERDFTVRLLASQKDGSRLFLGLIQPKQAIKLNAKDGQKLLVVNVKSEKVYDKFTVRYNSSVSKSLTAYTSPYKKRTPSETKELLKLEAVEKAKMSQVFLGHMKVNRLHPSVVVFTQKLEYYNLLQVRIRYV